MLCTHYHNVNILQPLHFIGEGGVFVSYVAQLGIGNETAAACKVFSHMIRTACTLARWPHTQ